jgi:hypothetical protein
MSKPTFLTSPDPEYHAATLRYSDFMTLGGHDLYRDLSDAAEREQTPWAGPTHLVMNQAIDAALACFRHPHYDLAETVIDFLRTVYADYGPETRRSAARFLKAANAYAYSHDC